MAAANKDLDTLTSQLQSFTLPEKCGVSFAGKGMKLNDANDAKPIVTEILNSEKLEFLNMEGNSLGVDAAEEIGKALKTRKEFKKALWKDMFTSRLKTEIPVALKHLTGSLMLAGAKIEVLDLSDNASGPIGVEGFVDFLRSPCCYSLRELRLNNMGLGVTGAKKLAKALLDLYNNSKNDGESLKLEVFVAGRNRLENNGAFALAQVFQKIGTLREISIPQNGIYHVGMTSLSAAFSENLSLEVINLNDNTITETGAASLSKALCKLNHLKSLDLGDCLLRSSGAVAIADSLHTLRHLKNINLSFNEVKGEAGLKVLRNLAALSPSLTSVNLDGNMFGPSIVSVLESESKQLNFPLESLEEDEGVDGEENEIDEEQVDEEEEDEEDGEEEEEDQEDTESDQPYNIGDKNNKTGDEIPEAGINQNEIHLVTSLLEALSVTTDSGVSKPAESNHVSSVVFDKTNCSPGSDGREMCATKLLNGSDLNTFIQNGVDVVSGDSRIDTFESGMDYVTEPTTVLNVEQSKFKESLMNGMKSNHYSSSSDESKMQQNNNDEAVESEQSMIDVDLVARESVEVSIAQNGSSTSAEPSLVLNGKGVSFKSVENQDSLFSSQETKLHNELCTRETGNIDNESDKIVLPTLQGGDMEQAQNICYESEVSNKETDNTVQTEVVLQTSQCGIAQFSNSNQSKCVIL